MEFITDMIEGVILAAGRGSRMKSLTEKRPKCLVLLDGNPLLAWPLAALRGAGVSRVSIVAGYRAEMLRGIGVDVITNPDWGSTNMVASLLCACDAIAPEATVIVSYSDIIYPSVYISRLMDCEGDIALVYDRQWFQLWKKRFVEPLDDAENFSIIDDRITAIGGRAANIKDINGQYMGIIKLSPAGIASIRRFIKEHPALRSTLDMTRLLQLLIAKNTQVRGVSVEGGWCEIDSDGDLDIAKRLLASGELPKIKQLDEGIYWSSGS